MRLVYLSLLLFFCFTHFQIYSENRQRMIEVQGHRGSRGTFPENTLAGFKAAIEAGVDGVELDLLATQDGEIVIHHDFHLNKKICRRLDAQPFKSSLIRNLSLSQLKELDCGSLVRSSYPRQQICSKEPIPTLQELFDLLHSSSHPHAKSLQLNLEIKRDPRHPQWTMHPGEFAQKLISQVNQNHFQNRICYTSFDPEVLSYVRALDPQASIGFIFGTETLTALSCDVETWKEPILHIASSLQANILSIEHVLVKDAQLVQNLKQAGYRVIVWTVNTPKRWKELIDMQVDGIITDYPQDLMDYLYRAR